jgi:hypothetical protein
MIAITELSRRPGHAEKPAFSRERLRDRVRALPTAEQVRQQTSELAASHALIGAIAGELSKPKN